MSDEDFPLSAYDDALFRQKRKHGKYRFVRPPRLEGPVADTHAHVHLLPDPPLAFARCAVWGVDYVCNIIDIHGGEPATFDLMDGWLHDAQERIPALLEASSAIAAAGKDEATNTHFAEKENLADCLPVACDAGNAPADQAWLSQPKVPHVRLAVGCHPHNAKFYDDALEQQLRHRLADPRVCAVGEIGLDYHYDLSPRDQQREVFRRQIRLAQEAGLPVALHVREAHDEAFRILQEEGFPQAGVLLHCFDLDWETLEPWVGEGCYVALGGALTFKRNSFTREAIARAPRELLLTETDSPYMTPEPMRGMMCEPSHTVFTAACMAEVRGCAEGEQRADLLDALRANARALLDRPATAWQLRQAGE